MEENRNLTEYFWCASCPPTSSSGLFPSKMGGAPPHPFFEGKALGTRLLVLIHMNGSKVSITATSPPASLPLKGLAYSYKFCDYDR